MAQHVDGGLPTGVDGGLDGGPGGLVDAGVDLCLLIAASDGGYLLTPGFDAGCSANGAGLAPFTVTALVADPTGNLRTLHYDWAICVTLDSDSRCGTDAEGYQALSAGDYQPTSISTELSTTFSLPESVERAAVGAGLSSVQIPVQLTVTAGAETDVGVKNLTVTPLLSFEPLVPNSNPVFAGITAGGVEWSVTSPPIFTSVAAATTSGGGPLGRAGGGTNSGVAIDPEMDAGAQYFIHYAVDGTPIEEEEVLQFQFYTTMGSFSPETAGRGESIVIPDAGSDGGAADAGPVDAGPDAGPPDESHWTSAANEAAQTVTFWVVVEDGRGGASWIERTAQFLP